MRKYLRKSIWVLILVVLFLGTGSGWVYNLVSSNRQLIKSNEMATLQTTFVQQYGSGAVIKQLVSPEKVYAALWSDGEGVSHVSWNIGGLWVTVYNSPTTNPTLSPTP